MWHVGHADLLATPYVTAGGTIAILRIVSESVRALSHSWTMKLCDSNNARMLVGSNPTISSRCVGCWSSSWTPK